MKKPSKLHNNSAGYGDHTNLIRMTEVYMIEHQEGIGSDASPLRTVQTFFDKHGGFLSRNDPLK